MIEKNKIYCPSRTNNKRRVDSNYDHSEDGVGVLNESVDEDSLHMIDGGYDVSIFKISEWLHDDTTLVFHDVLFSQCTYDTTDIKYDT
jgi:hypothetical protein